MQFINFMQNDDWVYYQNIENFLGNNFLLDPLTAPTFYSQGILGFIFAKTFSLQNLPFLTILVSLLGWVLFWKILQHYFCFSSQKSFLISLLLLFNPLFVYSMWGFMTENYFLFFLIVNLYLFYRFEKTNKFTDLIALLLSIFVSFMTRQVALVFPIAMSIYYFLHEKYKISLISLSAFFVLLASYVFVFPKTVEMSEKPLQFHHLFNPQYSFALIYGSLIYLSALLIPLILMFIRKLKFDPKSKLFLFAVMTVIFYFLLKNNYYPQAISWGEFPYFENIWERMGFYPRGIHGTKYQFVGNYDLYKYWDLTAKILVSAILSYMIISFKKKRLLDFNIIFIGIYLIVMLVTETFYDRYLLVIIPSLILFLAKNIQVNYKRPILLIGFILFLIFYNYQFSMDFILVNKYIWNKSKELAENEKIEPKLIQGTNAWKLKYRNLERNYLYNFSYDSQEVNENYRNNYKLIETKEIEYPFNFFIAPKIYLYMKNTN